MNQIVLDAPAGQVSAELERRGIDAARRVHVIVELADAPRSGDAELPMAALAQEGGAMDWLAAEPDLYSDADLIDRAR